MTLHTWGQQLALHPHIHCLVTAGGVDPQGQWRPSRRLHFLPAEPLKQRFRARMLKGLLRLAQRHDLRLPDGWSGADVERLVHHLRHKRWNVHVRKRYTSPAGVLNYLGRYLHGGPFGEQRLVAFDGSRVTFRYQDYRAERERVMILPTAEFVRRYLQHIPPQGFHMVRGFGLYRRGAQHNHLRDSIANVVPLLPEQRAELTDSRPSCTPAAGRTPCAICGVPVRLVTQVRPFQAWPRPAPIPIPT